MPPKIGNHSVERFSVRAAAAGTVEVYVYDAIGYYGITAAAFAKAMAPHKAAKDIAVRINSPGGSVFEAYAMYNLLVSHGASVHVRIDGLAASAASFLAMAGDTITIARNAMMMVHNPYLITGGTSKELARQAEAVGKIQQTLIDIYAARTGREASEIAALMDEETWMDADEALAMGFATEIGPELKAAALFAPEQLDAYAKVPADLMARLGLPAAADDGESEEIELEIPLNDSNERTSTMSKEIEAAVAAATADAAARAKAIREAFPNDPGMALDAIAANLTVEQAKAQAYDRLIKATGEKIAAAEAKVASAEEATATAEAKTAELLALLDQRGISVDAEAGDADGKVDSAAAATARQAAEGKGAADKGKPFCEAVAKHMAAGKSQAKAIEAAVKADPKAHQAWLAAGQPDLEPAAGD